MNTILNREHFEISRSDEYFNAKELQAQTGQPSYKFGEVVLKELIDNALDACENASINPVIQIGISSTEDRMRICVSDNGTGISEAVIKSILNFSTRTSDKG
jgi:DNA topoisomerase VI subunit B